VKKPFRSGLSGNRFVVSLPKIPFVVSLSNHALGAEAKSPESRLHRDDDINELVEPRL